MLQEDLSLSPRVPGINETHQSLQRRIQIQGKDDKMGLWLLHEQIPCAGIKIDGKLTKCLHQTQQR